MGIEPILPSTITPGKSGFGGSSGGGYEPTAPFRDNKSHTISDDPAEPDSENDPEQANS